jgi:UDP-4-amino-4-deoxy-L-arabinose-oxoglutarate aminotransferase
MSARDEDHHADDLIATATAILQAGAGCSLTSNPTPQSRRARVEAAITPRTKAIIPVHLFGQMCDMRVLRRLADRHGLVLVEDAAHCLEGRREGVRPERSTSPASFYATKSMTWLGGAGDARCCTAERVRSLRQQGSAPARQSAPATGTASRHGERAEVQHVQPAGRALIPQLEPRA